MTRVRGVISRQGTDLSPWINAYAEQYGGDPLGLCAGLISESDLNEQAERIGRYTREAQECIQVLIDAGEWP